MSEDLQARYDRVLAEYEAVEDYTDRHPYPSGMNKLCRLRDELTWLRQQLGIT